MSNYEPDRIWGILIAVGSGLCSCFFLGAGTVVAMLFGVMGHQGGPNNAPVLFGVLGGLVLLVGYFLAALYLLGVVGGIGIARGKKWGFNLILALGIIRAILSLSQLPHGLFGLVLDVACVVYCYQRMSGNLGPRPIY